MCSRVLRGVRVAAFTLLGLLNIIGPAEAAGFVYVAVPAEGCLPTPCSTPVVVVVDATYAVPTAGRVAVRFDDSRVFIQSRGTTEASRIDVFSTVTHSIVDTLPIGYPGGIAAAGSLDRLYIFEQTGLIPNCCGVSRVTLYDAGSLTELAHRDFGRDPMDLALSRDDMRLHVLLGGATTGFRLGLWAAVDAATLTGTTLQTKAQMRFARVFAAISKARRARGLRVHGLFAGSLASRRSTERATASCGRISARKRPASLSGFSAGRHIREERSMRPVVFRRAQRLLESLREPPAIGGAEACRRMLVSLSTWRRRGAGPRQIVFPRPRHSKRAPARAVR